MVNSIKVTITSIHYFQRLLQGKKCVKFVFLFLFLFFVLQNVAYPLEFDKGFQLLIPIHTVNRIEKQQCGSFIVTGSSYACLEKDWKKKRAMMLNYISIQLWI